MLNDLIRQLALEMLVGAVRHPDSKTRLELASLFWDLQYIYKFGIPKLSIPDPNGPEPHPLDPRWFQFDLFKWWNRAQPDPAPFHRLRLHEEVLTSMLFDFAGDLEPNFGDPDPQPSISGILRDTKMRLTAAKNLMQHLNKALPLLNEEIERLEKQLNQP